MVERVVAVRQDREAEAEDHAEALAATRTRPRRRPRSRRGRSRKDAQGIEGFLFPATYEFTPKTTGKQLVADQLEFFEEKWAGVDLAYAKKKNLTPVRRADHRLDGREGDDRVRGAAPRSRR